MTVSTDCLWYVKPSADAETKEWFNLEVESGRAPSGLPVFLDGVRKNNEAYKEFCGNAE